MKTDELIEKAFRKISTDLQKIDPSQQIDKEKFKMWIRRKARNLFKRDKNRAINIVQWNYKPHDYLDAILQTIINNDCSIDYYTKEVLCWEKIGTYNNDCSKEQGNDYKRALDLLPSIDHINAKPEPQFVICSWRTNDIKSNMSKNELVDWCRRFLLHQDKNQDNNGN